jgi:hypothetical protein
MNDKWDPVSVIIAGNDAVAPVDKAMGNALTQIGTIKGQRLSLPENFDLTKLHDTLNSLLTPNGVNVLYVCSDPFVRTNGTYIVQIAQQLGMKTVHEFAEWVLQHKGDLSYGPNFNDLFSMAGEFVNQIINYNIPAAKIPVFNPTVVNCVQVPYP